jgi:hypothetical protein
VTYTLSGSRRLQNTGCKIFCVYQQNSAQVAADTIHFGEQATCRWRRHGRRPALSCATTKANCSYRISRTVVTRWMRPSASCLAYLLPPMGTRCHNHIMIL